MEQIEIVTPNTAECIGIHQAIIAREIILECEGKVWPGNDPVWIQLNELESNLVNNLTGDELYIYTVLIEMTIN